MSASIRQRRRDHAQLPLAVPLRWHPRSCRRHPPRPPRCHSAHRRCHTRHPGSVPSASLCASRRRGGRSSRTRVAAGAAQKQSVHCSGQRHGRATARTHDDSPPVCQESTWGAPSLAPLGPTGVQTSPPDSNRCDTNQVPRALSNSREEQCACAWHHLCAISDGWLINTRDTATWSVTFLVLLVPVIGLSVLSGPSVVSIYLSFLSVMDLCVCAIAVGTRQGLAAAATAAGSPCVAAAAAAAGGVAVAATTIQAGRCVQHTLASNRAFISLNTIHARRGLHAATTRPSPAATPTNATRKRTRDSCGSRTSKRLSNGASAEEESECADYADDRSELAEVAAEGLSDCPCLS
jgi:hypothetical protein